MPSIFRIFSPRPRSPVSPTPIKKQQKVGEHHIEKSRTRKPRIHKNQDTSKPKKTLKERFFAFIKRRAPKNARNFAQANQASSSQDPIQESPTPSPQERRNQYLEQCMKSLQGNPIAFSEFYEAACGLEALPKEGNEQSNPFKWSGDIDVEKCLAFHGAIYELMEEFANNQQDKNVPFSQDMANMLGTIHHACNELNSETLPDGEKTSLPQESQLSKGNILSFLQEKMLNEPDHHHYSYVTRNLHEGDIPLFNTIQSKITTLEKDAFSKNCDTHLTDFIKAQSSPTLAKRTRELLRVAPFLTKENGKLINQEFVRNDFKKVMQKNAYQWLEIRDAFKQEITKNSNQNECENLQRACDYIESFIVEDTTVPLRRIDGSSSSSQDAIPKKIPKKIPRKIASVLKEKNTWRAVKLKPNEEIFQDFLQNHGEMFSKVVVDEVIITTDILKSKAIVYDGYKVGEITADHIVKDCEIGTKDHEGKIHFRLKVQSNIEKIAFKEEKIEEKPIVFLDLDKSTKVESDILGYIDQNGIHMTSGEHDASVLPIHSKKGFALSLENLGENARTYLSISPLNGDRTAVLGMINVFSDPDAKPEELIAHLHNNMNFKQNSKGFSTGKELSPEQKLLSNVVAMQSEEAQKAIARNLEKCVSFKEASLAFIDQAKNPEATVNDNYTSSWVNSELSPGAIPESFWTNSLEEIVALQDDLSKTLTDVTMGKIAPEMMAPNPEEGRVLLEAYKAKITPNVITYKKSHKNNNVEWREALFPEQEAQGAGENKKKLFLADYPRQTLLFDINNTHFNSREGALRSGHIADNHQEVSSMEEAIFDHMETHAINPTIEEKEGEPVPTEEGERIPQKDKQQVMDYLYSFCSQNHAHSIIMSPKANSNIHTDAYGQMTKDVDNVDTSQSLNSNFWFGNQSLAFKVYSDNKNIYADAVVTRKIKPFISSLGDALGPYMFDQCDLKKTTLSYKTTLVIPLDIGKDIHVDSLYEAHVFKDTPPLKSL